MLSRCFLDFSVGVGVFVTGLSQISSFFSCFEGKGCEIEGILIFSSSAFTKCRSLPNSTIFTKSKVRITSV